jgi:phosphatidylglycerol:prolipoprotein diacylglycerol transferase
VLDREAVPTLLHIPWFKPEPIRIPLDWTGLDVLPEKLELHPFGMLVAMGVLIGASLARRRAMREGLHPGVLGELAGYVLIGGFVLGHVLDAIFYHWDVVVERPLFLLELWNGLSSFGGFIGAVLGATVWVAMRRYSFVAFADPIAWAFPFGWLFGRLGCTVAHDHPGKVTDFFLAVENYHIRGGTPPWQVRHDLGLYEVFWCLAVIPLFLVLGRKRRKRGFYLALLPLLYAPVRFGLDFLRATDIPQADPRLVLGVLTPGHLGAILLLGAGLYMAWRVWTRPEPVVPPEARWTEGGGSERVAPEELGRLVEAARAQGGPRALDASAAERAEHVARWPGGLLVADLRGQPLPEVDWDAVHAEQAALGPATLRVWVTEGAQLEASPDPLFDAIAEARAADAEGPREPDALVVVEADAERPWLAAARARSLPVWTVPEGEDLPFAVVELDDGRIGVGMLGEPVASRDAA